MELPLQMALWRQSQENVAQGVLSRPAPLTWRLRAWSGQSFGEAHPPAVLPPGLLSRLPHQPFLVSSVTQFMRLTQGFAVLVELQGAGSELAPHHMAGFTRTKPGPPCLSWVGVKPNGTDLPVFH